MTDFDRPRLGENRPNDFVDSGGSFLSSCIGNSCPVFLGVSDAFKPASLSQKDLEKPPFRSPPQNDPFLDVEYGEDLRDTKAEHSKKWTKQKAKSQATAIRLRKVGDQKLGGKIDRCATGLVLNYFKDSNRFKVRPFSTCKNRCCDLCSWVRTTKLFGYAAHNHPELVKGKGALRYRFLTLTVENCSYDELRSTVKKMLKALRPLAKVKEWDALGWVRSLEITYNEKTNTYHPHIHILMASPWNSPMTTQRRWCAIWKRLMNLDYIPVCHIEAPKRREGMSIAMSGMSETVKYLFKPADFEENVNELAAAFNAVKGMKLLHGGGIFKKIFEKPLSEEVEEPLKVGSFAWRANEEVFRRILKRGLV